MEIARRAIDDIPPGHEARQKSKRNNADFHQRATGEGEIMSLGLPIPM